MAERLPRTDPPVRVRVGSASDPGRVRGSNEDRVYVDPAQGIFIVADGVGGHAAGEVAAAIAVEVIPQRLSRPSLDRAQAMREAIALANNEIHAQASARPEYAGMTCVLTAVHLVDGHATVGHVGDSRLYRLDRDGIRKVTHDHSPIGEREDDGELSETDAMRHPRRNEVFRDVGSAFHDPDDPQFIEIVEMPFDDRAALLICSDGLSDMITSSAIERLVRMHAGDPARVAEALVLAANEAGGRDNVSIVYVEGEGFDTALASAGVAGRTGSGSTGTDARTEGQLVPTNLATATGAEPPRRAHAGRWLVAGLVAGLAAGLGVAWVVTLDDPIALAAPRVLEVNRAATGGDTALADVLATARPGDTVQLGPGEYVGAVILPDGVHLEARDPGTVTLLAPSETPEAVVLTATGGVGSRITGLRVAGTKASPAAVGILIAGAGIELDDVTIEGTLGVGLDVASNATARVRASRLSGIEGVALRAATGARPAIARSLFLQGSGGGRVLDVAADASPAFEENVFVGFPELTRAGAEARRHLPPGNLVLNAPTPTAARRGGR